MECDRSVGVSATVDDVHHGHRKNIRVGAADVLVEGKIEIVGSSLGYCERYAENGVGAEIALGLCAVESDHCLVNLDLVESRHALEGLGDRAIDISHSLLDTLAHIAALVTVAKLESLVDAGGCSGGNGCASACTRLKDYVYFHGGVAARVEHLTTDDLFDFHNLVLL